MFTYYQILIYRKTALCRVYNYLGKPVALYDNRKILIDSDWIRLPSIEITKKYYMSIKKEIIK